jgi:hypothetical protein
MPVESIVVRTATGWWFAGLGSVDEDVREFEGAVAEVFRLGVLTDMGVDMGWQVVEAGDRYMAAMKKLEARLR